VCAVLLSLYGTHHDLMVGVLVQLKIGRLGPTSQTVPFDFIFYLQCGYFQIGDRVTNTIYIATLDFFFSLKKNRLV
jgi:hypothetical protein